VEGSNVEHVALAAIVFALICLAVVWQGREAAASFKPRFERRFPPISDAEFVARCTPGTDPAVALMVRADLPLHEVRG
jgi:hypothetical protein